MKEESFTSVTYNSRHGSRPQTTVPKFHRQKFLRLGGRLFVPVFAIFGLMLTFSTSAQQGGGRGNKVWGDRYKAGTKIQLPERSSPGRGRDTMARYRHWNEVAINASGLDHTPVPLGDPRIFGEQVGPGRSARAMAIVHIAVFDVINAILGGYESFTGIPSVNQDTSIDSAIAQAAHDTLVVCFPSQTAAFDQELANDLSEIPDGIAKTNGIALGQQAAAAIVALKSGDGSAHPEPQLGIGFFPSDQPGKWRQDPISLLTVALGAHWGEVNPFVLTSGDQFRAPAPPSMASQAYTNAFREVKRLGGDGVVTSTERTTEQTEIGIYWAYDGTPSLCAPPRLYNQIAMQIAEQRNTRHILDLARLMALVNTSMADAGIAIWESKFFYNYWRPVNGIRESDPGTGPTGQGDGNPSTIGDLNFSPLGAPASGLTGPNFTPPFPAYPSGHAGFGGSLFQTLRNFYNTDHIRFTFVSDELNGITVDNQGNPRQLRPRTFRTLSQAEEENGQSRIYLGIHWSFDKTEGIAQGRRVADYVFANAFRPVRGNH
ncbi:MAG TPA: hypothetical protein VFD48_00655 [Pyrinomonadaceae bacterium]|nr:hypothetical protein [Pyrinomonadaceae bacterium]